MKLTMAEQETIVRWDRESDSMDIFTHSPAQARKLIVKGAKVLRHSKDTGCWKLECPKTWFRWPRPRRTKQNRQNPPAEAKSSAEVAS